MSAASPSQESGSRGHHRGAPQKKTHLTTVRTGDLLIMWRRPQRASPLPPDLRGGPVSSSGRSCPDGGRISRVVLQVLHTVVSDSPRSAPFLLERLKSLYGFDINAEDSVRRRSRRQRRARVELPPPPLPSGHSQRRHFVTCGLA